jgi:hypothetical protein
MNYKLGKYLANTDDFEFVFDDDRWTNIDLVNNFPNYIHSSETQTTYDKKCYEENPYSDNGKLYIVLYNLYNETTQITML